ncbi:respiratory nitrate reductase subunit gamma [Effusibacillus dendaii]|uniref:Nitrate reductase subunit gamma n=1 Tax=Effusibacillus dendaii TaxID=2743772 RepID=A0A7I8D550_9BACL|nr:respiratory nitrate reductase subunit gamma [Effusibacillus dendaii]BCJ85187.1 nitrate reductase subunit gamma [Effusibacillus dendaii]
MNFGSQFLWVIYPYLMLTTFVVGHIYRYNTDQLAWTAKSSEFLEKKTLRWGSMLFHMGIFLVLIGHLAGLLIPKEFTESIGVTEELYHAGAVYGGGFAGILTFVGIAILLFRRLSVPRVRKTSDASDILVAVLLFLVIGMGIFSTIGYNVTGSYDYRETIAPWIRGILTFAPNPGLMADVPLFFKLHILFTFAIFGVWPFTRLVHVWSVPLAYFRRSYIVYRSRNTRHV